MTAGEYRNRMIIEQLKANASVGNDGHPDFANDDNWQEVTRRWARIVPQGGREFERAQQVEATLTHLLRIRSDAITRQIQPTWRIRFAHQHRVLQVLSNRNVEELGAVQELSCLEVQR